MNKRVLIIEDDKEMCRELTEALTFSGSSVDTAFDGIAGKKMIMKNNYDVIVLDLKLPKVDGYQIIQFVKKNMIPASIIVITARMKVKYEENVHQNHDKRNDELLKEVHAVLIKPFSLPELIDRIND